MDGGLDIGTVEVVVGAAAERWEAYFIPEIWAEVRQVIDVEARVDVQEGSVDIVPDGAARLRGVWSRWQLARRGVGQSLVEEIEVTTLLGPFVDLSRERFVERKNGLEVVQRGYSRSYCHQFVVATGCQNGPNIPYIRVSSSLIDGSLI